MTAPHQLVNPYLPSWEYVPDGEPKVFGDRLYVFGSHDRFAGRKYCMNDYRVWSAPLDDLSAWTNHGVSYRKEQDPGNRKGKKALWAPDVVQGIDGRHYLYYGLEFVPRLAVAVADTPAGPYDFYGYVEYPNGARLGSEPGDVFPFDPGALVDDDGRVFLYFGFAPTARVVSFQIDRHKLQHEGAYVVEVGSDMRTIRGGPSVIVPMAGKSAGSGFEGHEFYEAPSMRKIDGTYFLTYSSIKGHELCYATSTHPDREFSYAGTLISNGDIGFGDRSTDDAVASWANNHGGLAQVGDAWYVFYHRHTNREQTSRQGLAEKIERTPDGRFLQAEMTSAGLFGAPLPGIGRYSAHIACVLRSAAGAKEMPYKSLVRRGRHPFLTQSGGDREGDGDQHVANLRNGAVAGFKYFDLRRTRGIELRTRGADGRVEIATELDGPAIAEVPVDRLSERSVIVELPGHLAPRTALYLRYRGKGALDLRSFTLLGETR